MKKLILLVAAVYGAYILATSIPSIGFYILMMPVIVGFVLLRSSGAGRRDQDRARLREALQAVRAGMPYEQASHYYGVPEHAIRRYRRQVFHIYFD